MQHTITEHYTKYNTERRYGRKSDSSNRAWKILLDTVYRAEKICSDKAHRNVLLIQDPGLV